MSMFGLGEEKKKGDSWEFDLEKDMKNPQTARQWKETMNDRIQNLKTLMRKGEDKATFDEAQNLLHGYLAAQKVIQRIGK